MEKTQNRTLYEQILKTREATAGDDIQNFDKVADMLTEAIHTAKAIHASDILIGKLNTALNMIRNAKCYGDRLPVDNILCNLINSGMVT
jgi:hypothetical protein